MQAVIVLNAQVLIGPIIPIIPTIPTVLIVLIVLIIPIVLIIILNAQVLTILTDVIVSHAASHGDLVRTHVILVGTHVILVGTFVVLNREQVLRVLRDL